MRNHRAIKPIPSEKGRKRLVSEPNYHSCKKISNHLVAIEMKKTRVKMNKPLHLGKSILDISKILMYEFWCNYIVTKYGDRAKLPKYAIQILTLLLFILKPKIFLKIFLMMLRNS